MSGETSLAAELREMADAIGDHMEDPEIAVRLCAADALDAQDTEIVQLTLAVEDNRGAAKQWADQYTEDARVHRAEAARLNERIAALEEALEPFAKCSEVYPRALPEARISFGSVLDDRCPLTFADYHRARSLLTASRNTGGADG